MKIKYLILVKHLLCTFTLCDNSKIWAWITSNVHQFSFDICFYKMLKVIVVLLALAALVLSASVDFGSFFFFFSHSLNVEVNVKSTPNIRVNSKEGLVLWIRTLFHRSLSCGVGWSKWLLPLHKVGPFYNSLLSTKFHFSSEISFRL